MTQAEETALEVRMRLEGKVILWGDGKHDDTLGYDTWNWGKGTVVLPDGSKVKSVLLLSSGTRIWIPEYTLDTDPLHQRFRNIASDSGIEISIDKVNPWINTNPNDSNNT